MAGYKTTDVVDVLSRKDETSQAVRGRMAYKSAVARLGNKIDMTSRVVGFLNIARPSAHFNAYGAARTGSLVSASSINMEAKPLTATLVFDKYMERDVADFSAEFSRKLGDAFAEALDREVLLNTDGAFSSGVIAAAVAASHTVTESASLYTDLNAAMGKVETAGFDVSGIIYRKADRQSVRAALSTTGQPIFSISARDGEPDMLMGVSAVVAAGTSLPKTASTGENRFIAGDWSQCYFGIYEDLKLETHTSGIVTIGGIDYNLIQQGLVAVVAEMRIAAAVQDGNAFAVLVEA
jgi:HK97 family phage major capsid protein